MKRTVTIAAIVMIAAFTTGIYAQELDSLKKIMGMEKEVPADTQDKEAPLPVIIDDNGEEVKIKILDKDVVKVYESGDSTYVKVGSKGKIQVIDQPDSTTIRVGNKEIKIVERDYGTDIKVNDVRRHHDHFKKRKFRGHWAGFEWGINNFLDSDYSLSRESDAWFMDLNTGRSWAINMNFAQYSLGFGTSQAGMVTGMGLEFNNYFFDNKNTIIDGDVTTGVLLDGNVTKSKLTTTFLRVPLIFEVQFPNISRAKRVYLSAGGVVGFKLGSHTKVVTKDDGGKKKDKNRDDFNINPFRYGLTARAGIGSISLFCDYYFNTFFVTDKGPELNPFTVGLAMNF